MDLKGNAQKKFIFERELDEECYSYGWGRGLMKASDLYSQNLTMKEEIEKYKIKLNSYREEIKRLHNIINDNNIDDKLNVQMSDSLSDDIFDDADEINEK